MVASWNRLVEERLQHQLLWVFLRDFVVESVPIAAQRKRISATVRCNRELELVVHIFEFLKASVQCSFNHNLEHLSIRHD